MASSQNIRVRFAPSPTGNLHIGGMRTALFNYLFAKHYQGTFLIRIENTDLERSKPEFVTAQLAALEWCGIESDEPLVFQSQRTQAYQEVLSKLFQEKKSIVVCAVQKRLKLALKHRVILMNFLRMINSVVIRIFQLIVENHLLFGLQFQKSNSQLWLMI
jgi:glutamyl/glutaminyl-tRNA synthetase